MSADSRPIPPPPPLQQSPLPPSRVPRSGVVVGKVVEVVVVTVLDREVEVRLADGRIGVIARREFSSVPTVGESVVAAQLVRDDPKGRLVLSYEWGRKQVLWEQMGAAKVDATPVRGTVTSVVKGGAVVDVGLRGFLPASMVGEDPSADPRALVGTEIEVLVVDVDPVKERLVVSRRDLLRRQRRQAERAAYSALKVGSNVPGVVVSVADFGAIVELGGVRGLVHRSELSWGYFADVADVVREGDEVVVKVLDVNRSKKKVALSLRGANADPLQQVVVGAVHDAVATRVVEYGCFVRLTDDGVAGAEGLVHLSELTEVGGYRADQLVAPGE
ncbi:MAG: S1 RNA-binding domain-containing protein, partial [Actinomycetes bacterium]